MINRNFQKKVKKKSGFTFYLTIVILILVFVIVITYMNAIPTIRVSALNQSNLILQSAVNDIANDVITKNAQSVNNILQITYRDKNTSEVTSVNTDAVAVMAIQNSVAQALSTQFSKGVPIKYRVALSTLLGYDFLMGARMFCDLHINPFTDIDVDIESVFEDAGINQTKINIVLKTVCIADVSIGRYKKTVTVENEFILAQRHIIGDVPSITGDK